MGQKKTLHICHSPMTKGEIILALGKQDNDVLCFDYCFDVDGLPKDLSKGEIERCNNLSHCSLWHLPDRVAFDEYSKLIVWHSWDSASLLILYFVCTLHKSNLYHINVSDRDFALTHHNVENLIRKAKLLQEWENEKFCNIYKSMLGTDGIPKIAKGYQIVCKSKEFVKEKLMENIKAHPQYYGVILGKTIARFPRNYCFHASYLEYILFEMLNEGSIEPTGIVKSENLERFFNTTFHYKGESIGNWQKFKIMRIKKSLLYHSVNE